MIKEDTGICLQCSRGNHDHCQMVMGGNKAGMVFCTCQCSGLDTSLGAPPGTFQKKIPSRVKKQFPKHEIDPLKDIF